jgi:metallo-beta-lactamase family protein
MRLRFLGANRQVTGSCTLLEAGGARILIDCGLYQERQLLPRNWDPLPVDAATLDAVILTHAHLDHCGLLPKLVREGFAGPIHATPPTLEIVEIVLSDAARIAEDDVAFKKARHAREGRVGPHPYVPIYTREEAEAVFPLLRAVGYGERIRIQSGLVAQLRDAGHILGSAMVEITADEGAGPQRLVFTGDLGQPEVPIVREPTRFRRADIVVMESTYGDRDHEHTREIEEQLADAIVATDRRGGNVLIPTFAIERAQQLLLHLARLLEERRIPPLLVFLDSPMAVNVTEVYARWSEYMDEETRNAFASGRFSNVESWLKLVRSADESKAINRIRGTCIILAGSGMCTGGRIKHHLVQNIERSASTLLFAGYQAQGTLGRQILQGDPKVRILGRSYHVRADVRQIQGLSAHAGRDDLLAWLGAFEAPPRRLFLVHGEEKVALSLAERVRGDLGWSVEVPRYEQEALLDDSASG